MIVYKFRVGFEDHDNFQRVIILRADQTFEDFHQAILGNLGLDPGMQASFFVCDHRFRKKYEIVLQDTDADAPENVGEEGVAGGKNSSMRMQDAALKDCIDDPHQRLLYVYDPLNKWTFYIELTKILPVDADEDYPRLVKSVGPVPRELVATPKQIPGVETPMDFSFGEGDAPPGDLTDFDQIEHDEPFPGNDEEFNSGDDEPDK